MIVHQHSMLSACVGSKDVLTGVEDLEVPEGGVASVLDVVAERGGDVRYNRGHVSVCIHETDFEA
jgi:hypothetical protein